jgi:hypothetical protein
MPRRAIARDAEGGFRPLYQTVTEKRRAMRP